LLQVLHTEQLGRHLRQTHASKLEMKTKTMCENRADVQITDARGPIQRRA
jgi:hypothetical protein